MCGILRLRRTGASQQSEYCAQNRLQAVLTVEISGAGNGQGRTGEPSAAYVVRVDAEPMEIGCRCLAKRNGEGGGKVSRGADVLASEACVLCEGRDRWRRR